MGEELAAGRELGSRSEVEFVGSGLRGRRGELRAPPRSCRSGPALVTVVLELPIGWAPSGGGGLKPRGEPVGRPSAGAPDSLAGPDPLGTSARGVGQPVGPFSVVPPSGLPDDFPTPPLVLLSPVLGSAPSSECRLSWEMNRIFPAECRSSSSSPVTHSRPHRGDS